METKEKALTREEQVKELQAEYNRRMSNVAEFERKLQTLRLSLLVMDREKSKQVDEVLDSLPEMSAKGVLDRVLQIPMEKRTQLNENIKKLELAIENETRRAGEVAGKRKAIETQIHQEKVDTHARVTEEKFKE